MNEEGQSAGSMRLRILLPTEVLVDEKVQKIVAEAVNGSFCLLPRHVDFVAALVPGILSFVDMNHTEQFAAVAEGVLVKRAGDVHVSTLSAVRGTRLGELQAMIAERFLELDEHERRARTALGRLEAATLRRFRELQERFHG